MTLVKFCGMRTLDDARQAIELGVDALGFVLADSPRRVTPDFAAQAVRELGGGDCLLVGVVVDPTLEEAERLLRETGLTALQLCGNESPELVRSLGSAAWKVVHVGSDAPDAQVERYSATGARILLDTGGVAVRGGSGTTFDWSLAQQACRQHEVIVAGGLDPANVATMIAELHPFGVDVSSGIEQNGSHSRERMERFLDEVRAASDSEDRR